MHDAPNVGWPRDAADLRSTTHCPSCFAALSTTRCSNCGLELAQEGAAQLALDSAVIADLLEDRRRTLERMHANSVPSAAPVAAPALTAPTSWAAPSGPRRTPPAVASAAAPVPVPVHMPMPMQHAPRRSSVQLWLVVAATGLLSIGFIGFLVYAFVNWGLVWQALVLGLVTAAAATGAALLRRFGLQRSAEGVAVVALVLALLDAWAARVNDVAGLAGGTETAFWGGALLVIGALALLWGRLSGLRLPGLTGSALLLPGAGLLAAAALPGATIAERWWLAGVVAGALGLLGGIRAGALLRPAERMLWLGTAGTALVSAALAATAIGNPPLADLTMPTILLVATAHAVLLLRGEQGRVITGFAGGFALLAVLGVATALIPIAWRVGAAELYLLSTLPALALLAALLELLTRTAAAHRRSVALVGAVGAGALGAIPAGGALLVLGAGWIAAAGAGALGWSADFADLAPLRGTLAIAAFIALAATAAVHLGAQRIGGSGPVRRRTGAGLVAVILALSPAVLPTLGGRLVLAAVLALVALAALRVPGLARHRVAALGIALAAAALLLSLGWGGPQLVWAALLGAALLPASMLLHRGDRSALLIGLLPLAAVGGLVHPGALSSAPWLGATMAALLLLGLLPWLRADAGAASLRALAGGGLPVLASLGAGSLLLQLDAEPSTAVLVLAGLGVLAVALAMLGGPALRAPAEVGAALVLLAASLLLLAAPGARTLLLVLLAVAAMLAAVRREGVVGAPGLRKHWGWVALGIGALALVDALQRSRIDLVEAHTLPIAGVLLLLAAWIAAVDRRRGAAGGAAGPAALLAGLLLALLPSAVPDEQPLRSIAVLALAGLALLAGAYGPAGRGRLWFDALATAGAATVLLSGLLRLLQGGGELPRTEPWALAAVVLLIAAAIGLAGRWRGRGTAHVAAPPGLVAAASALLALSGAAAAGAEQGATRGTIALILLVAVHPLAVLLRRSPWSPWTGWTALALGGALGLHLLLLGGVELEAVTTPVGTALLIAGGVAMRRGPQLRSWPALGAGAVVLLVPSCLAAIVDPAPWRVAAVGLLAVAAIVVGATMRLQAPFLLGIAVALVHAVAQLQPWIRAVVEATPLFLWPVLGGALVLALAIRFERRLQTLRTVVLRVASLR